MGNEQSPARVFLTPRFELGRFLRRETGTAQDISPAEALREALAREDILLARVKAAMEEYDNLRAESDHRLLNGLQMVISLLKMQSRAATPDAAVQLSAAAQRVMAIERIHRRLHINDGTKFVAFKKYLVEFCKDFSGIMMPDEGSAPDILVVSDDISLPTATAIPLGFIISELLTNAIKYGKGNIRVRLEGRPNALCALIVSNDGPALAENYDPAASKGLGMKIVQSFVRQIHGAFQFGCCEGGQGAEFTVLFPDCREIPPS